MSNDKGDGNPTIRLLQKSASAAWPTLVTETTDTPLITLPGVNPPRLILLTMQDSNGPSLEYTRASRPVDGLDNQGEVERVLRQWFSTDNGVESIDECVT